MISKRKGRTLNFTLSNNHTTMRLGLRTCSAFVRRETARMLGASTHAIRSPNERHRPLSVVIRKFNLIGNKPSKTGNKVWGSDLRDRGWNQGRPSNQPRSKDIHPDLQIRLCPNFRYNHRRNSKYRTSAIQFKVIQTNMTDISLINWVQQLKMDNTACRTK